MEHAMTSPTIATHDLTKLFGKFQALDRLTLQDGGGISGFVGPNGAGKTTTIHVLMGFIKPTYGKAAIFNLDSWSKSAQIRKRIGFLPEKPAYPGVFTAKRFLEHIAHFHRLQEPRQKAKKVLEEVGLGSASEKQIKTYSAGMQQRLGLAQAIMSNPELVILDEPTANLDPTGRMDLLEKIKRLHKDKSMKFFISTHILSELEKVCSWVSIIDQGALVDQGPIQELSEKYSENTYKITVSDPAKLMEALQNQPFIEQIRQEENSIYVRIKNTQAFMKSFFKTMAKEEIEIKEFKQTQGALEQIYDMSVRRKKPPT
jgi:ABC-2 type transport system ATP-binding protein